MKQGYLTPESEIVLLRMGEVLALSDAGEATDPEFELNDD